MKQIDRKCSYGKLKLSMLPGGSISDTVSGRNVGRSFPGEDETGRKTPEHRRGRSHSSGFYMPVRTVAAFRYASNKKQGLTLFFDGRRVEPLESA